MIVLLDDSDRKKFNLDKKQKLMCSSIEILVPSSCSVGAGGIGMPASRGTPPQ